MEIDKLNAFPPFAQANVRTTAQQLVTTSEAAATVRGDIGLTYNEIIQRSSLTYPTLLQVVNALLKVETS